MLIKNIEKKMKTGLVLSVSIFLLATIILLGSLYYVHASNVESKKNIYVLDNGVPVLVTQTSLRTNREVEIKSHVNTYHMLFFTIPPDNKFIEKNMNKAMYLIDDSGLKEYQNLKERGFYNQILASSSQLSIVTDSIVLSNTEKRKFTYYGKQRIDRKSSVIIRSIITEGFVEDLYERTDNNPHAAIIRSWHTLKNADIETKQKNAFQ